MKKLLLVLFFVLCSIGAYSQNKTIWYSDRFINSSDEVGYVNVRIVFDWNNELYYKIVDEVKNPTYLIVDWDKKRYLGEPYLELKVWSPNGSVTKVIIREGMISEVFDNGSWQRMYCYDYINY